MEHHLENTLPSDEKHDMSGPTDCELGATDRVSGPIDRELGAKDEMPNKGKGKGKGKATDTNKKPDTQGKKGKKEKEEKEEKEICSICANHYTSVIRRKVVCKYCSKDTCAKCIEQYLLGRIEDAHCLHCRVNYTDATLREICTKTYLTQTYYKHRQEILINRERATLPALQENAHREQFHRTQKEKLAELNAQYIQTKDQFTLCNLEWSLLLHKFQKLFKEEKNDQVSDERIAIQEKLESESRRKSELKRQYGDILSLIEVTKRQRYQNAEGVQEEEKKEDRKKFIRKCMRAGCQGFLSTAWKCGLCDHYNCSKCMAIIGTDRDAEHTCSADDIATAELIRSNSKPCPKCGEFIEKTSGCDQMFCISCHTPWSWTSGKIVTHGVIHNPHYFEWMRRHQNGQEVARNPADVPCGGYPEAHELRILTNVDVNLNYSYREFYRICMEVQELITEHYRSHLDRQELTNIHVRFLLGDFDEKRWGQLLASHERRMKSDSEIQEVFAAFRGIAVEFINRIQYYRDESVDTFTLLPRSRANPYMLHWLHEIYQMVIMINQGLIQVAESYHTRIPYLHIVHYSRVTSRGNFYHMIPRTSLEEAKKMLEYDRQHFSAVSPVVRE